MSSKIILEPFPTISQQKKKSCGPATILLLMEYLQQAGYLDVDKTLPSEAELARCGRTHSITGTTVWGMCRQLDYFLAGHGFSHQAMYATTYELLLDALMKGLPPIVLFPVHKKDNPHRQDPDHFDKMGLHRGLLYGLDMHERCVYVSHPFGVKERFHFDEWEQRFAPDLSRCDWGEKLVKSIGIVRSKTAIFLDYMR